MVANKFDQKVLGDITPPGAKTMSEKKKTPPDSLPSKPDETQEEEIKREITILINGKRVQLVEVDGTFHLADKDKGHGLSVTQNGDVVIVSGAGGNGNACGGRMLINARGGQWYKGGAIVQEASADESESTGLNGTDSSKESQDSSGKTKTTQAGKDGLACSQMFYGDHVEECHGNITIKARNITFDASETFTIVAGEQISIQSGPKAGGNLTLKAGQLDVNVDTYTEKVTANKILDGTPETTRIGYDPRTSENTVGWFNVNTNITGDYVATIGGVMHTTVAGAAPPPGVAGLIADRTTAYSISVAIGTLKLATLAGSALFSFGTDAPFPTSLAELKPGSFNVKAVSGISMTAGLDLPSTSLPGIGDIVMSANTKVSVDALTDINIKARKDVNVESTTGDISILSTSGKIYLN